MFNPTRTALYIAIGAMSFAATEAYAGCKVVSGTYMCATWIKGSEICQVTIDGNDVVPPGSSPEVTCYVNSAYVDGAEGLTGCGDTLPPGTLQCAEDVEGEGFAALSTAQTSVSGATAKGLAKGKGNGKGKGHDKGKHKCKHPDKDSGCYFGVPGEDSGIPPVEDEFGDPVSELSKTVVATCDEIPGPTSCSATAEVKPEGLYCGDPDNGNEAIDFTATEFIATVRVCGVDDSLDTYPDGCVELYQLCTLQGNHYNCIDLNDNPSYPNFDGDTCASGGYWD